MTTNLIFHRTDSFDGRSWPANLDSLYAAFTNNGAKLGWVSGGHGNFRFFAEGSKAWGPSATTRSKAVEAFYVHKAIDDASRAHRSKQPPVSVFTVRLTSANLVDELPELVGCLIVGAEDLGEVVSARVTSDGRSNARIVGTTGRDILGLPSEITAYKL